MATYRRVCVVFIVGVLLLFKSTTAEDDSALANTKFGRRNDNDNTNKRPLKSVDGAANQPPKHHSVKLASVPECQEDVKKLCSGGSTTNNFAVLDCLQNDKDVSSISKTCQHFIWMYKQNLTKDSRFDSAAQDVCKSALSQFKACSDLPKGEGQVISCLYEYKENVTDTNCKQFLNKMGSIIFSDYRLIFKFNEKCSADIETTQCGRMKGHEDETHSQGPTIECLSDKVKDLSDDCKHEILRVAELQADDYHLDRALFYACRDDRENFCKRVKAGNGKVYRCLFKHKFEKEMSTDCREQLTRRQKLMQDDYKTNKGLAATCKKDIRENGCMKGEKRPDSSVTDLKEGRMSHILLCLEDAIKQDKKVSPECIAEMKEVRKGLMEDYKISPDIVRNCAAYITEECKGLERNGKTLHCLMDLARDKRNRDKFNSDCKNALNELLVEADVSSSWDVDPTIRDACQQVVDTACKGVKTGDGRVLGCLMEKVGTEKMTDECEEKLMELQYFMARDFRLDARMFKYCEKDAIKQCHAPEGWYEKGTNVPNYPLVFNCLYQHLKLYSHDAEKQLSHACQFEVKRVMRQRALSVDLEPRIESNCVIDLGAFCSDKTGRGKEIECLQEHMDDLEDKCRWAVGNFTQDEDEDVNLDTILMKACSPMIKNFCQEELKDRSVGPGDVMECLIENKNNDQMDPKCAAGIEHHQLVNLKDYRFSFKFKEGCKSDVMKLCKGIKKKSDVVQCLSEFVRNDTLLGDKPRVSQMCRRQLRFELLQRGEDIQLDPKLQEACSFDIDEKCRHKKGGNGEVIECLKNHAKDLDPECKKMVFKRERLGSILPNMDFSLVTKCAPMIKVSS